MSTYTFAGTSRLNGTIKVRFANDAARVKVLAKNGHTDIDLIELKHPMTKEEIVAYLREIDFARGNPEIQAAIDAADEKRNPKEKPPKEPKEPNAKKEPKAKKEKALAAGLWNGIFNTDPSEEWKKVVMGIRNQVNEMIERGELDESEFDNKVDELVAAEEAREEAEIRASIEADLEAARAANAPAREMPDEEWKKVVMGIRIQVNEMIERGELDESEFDNKVDELVAAEAAREEAEIRASIEADLEAARAANAPALIEETTAKVVPVDETATEEQDEEAPY